MKGKFLFVLFLLIAFIVKGGGNLPLRLPGGITIPPVITPKISSPVNLMLAPRELMLAPRDDLMLTPRDDLMLTPRDLMLTPRDLMLTPRNDLMLTPRDDLMLTPRDLMLTPRDTIFDFERKIYLFEDNAIKTQQDILENELNKVLKDILIYDDNILKDILKDELFVNDALKDVLKEIDIMDCDSHQSSKTLKELFINNYIDKKDGEKKESYEISSVDLIGLLTYLIYDKSSFKSKVSNEVDQTPFFQINEEETYEIIFKCNPITWIQNGYEIDRSTQLGGKLKTIHYVLILTDKQDKTTWVDVSFRPPTQNLADLGIPKSGSPVLQTYVEDLDVITDSPNVKTGHFSHGSIEFWPFDYIPDTKLDIPNASDNTYDFNDTPLSIGNYTSMQIHNSKEQQVIMAINKPHMGSNGELGIGNNTIMPPNGDKGKTPNPDWTYTNSANLYKSATLIIYGQFVNLKLKNP